MPQFYRFVHIFLLVNCWLQWNLSIADMLYIGHLSIADTFSRNQLSPAMVNPSYFETLSSGHLSIADTFFENQWCPLLRGFTVFKIPLNKLHTFSSNISGFAEFLFNWMWISILNCINNYELNVLIKINKYCRNDFYLVQLLCFTRVGFYEPQVVR